jgi:hypothetical protein
MHPPYMKRLSPSLPDGPTFLRRSVVGSISNRGRNYEPARLRSFCGQQNLKSHSVPRLIGGACRRMAAHVLRLPRLTLKAGRKAGSPRDGWADRGNTQKSKSAKFEISKIEKRKNHNSENFHFNFFHEIDHEIVSARSYSCSRVREQDFRLFASWQLFFAMCEVQT